MPMKPIVAASVAFALLWMPNAPVFYPAQVKAITAAIEQAGNQLAAVILAHNPKTVAELEAAYDGATISVVGAVSPVATTSATSATFVATTSPTRVRVLLVPGHEPGFGGAEYGSLKERVLNVALADDLQALLDKDPHYQVFITRDDYAWNPVFANYFKQNWAGIIAWERASKVEMNHLIAIGSTTRPVATEYHNTAPDNVAIRLYGITKWANENNIDITIHIHFNDVPNRPANGPGKPTGFAIYVPAEQYDNSSTTRSIAQAIFNRLKSYTTVSDLPVESEGIISEPGLIAIGANNTANAASMLIEYAYIYQHQLTNAKTRAAFLHGLAEQTYLGLRDFFEANSPAATARTNTLQKIDQIGSGAVF